MATSAAVTVTAPTVDPAARARAGGNGSAPSHEVKARKAGPLRSLVNEETAKTIPIRPRHASVALAMDIRRTRGSSAVQQ
jgi:hypothetical protein